MPGSSLPWQSRNSLGMGKREIRTVAESRDKTPEPRKAVDPAAGADTPGAGEAGATSSDTLAPEVRAMADSCFTRAEQATVAGNFDYAFHLYIEGLRYNPRDIERGHKGLRDSALRRSGSG
jgi:hypothetical protein